MTIEEKIFRAALGCDEDEVAELVKGLGVYELRNLLDACELITESAEEQLREFL